MQSQTGLRLAAPPTATMAPGARCVFVAGGKGGVGKTHIALNLATALAQRGARVALLDGQAGLGHLDLLCGLNGYWTVGHVIAGARTLPEICLTGPAGMHVYPGASALWELLPDQSPIQTELDRQLEELALQHDYLVWDGCPTNHSVARQWLTAADLTLLVTVPELTAIADAYAWIKNQRRLDPKRLRLLVNRAENSAQCREIVDRIQRTTRLFLHQDLASAGWLPEDASLGRAIQQRTPLLLSVPQAPLSTALSALARQLQRELESTPCPQSGQYFARLRQEPVRRAA